MGIARPNLPHGQVDRLMIGGKYSFLAAPLKDFCVETVLMPDITEVDARLSGHADLAALAIGEKMLLGGRAGALIEPKVRDLGWKTELLPIKGDEYPDDAALNACVMGEYVIHNAGVSAVYDSEKFINIRQGYAKCSICPVTERALITSDMGIAKVCERAGFDVLRIRPGDVLLPGFEYGFIGGATFKLSPDVLAFTGDIYRHRDSAAIITFIKKYNVEPLCLTDGELLDIGSAVLLTEK